MKLQAVLDMVGKIKPGNPYDTATKIQWLNELEGDIQSRLLNTAPQEIIQYTEDDLEATLLIPVPYDKVYWMWVSAMIDFANGEYDKYQNTMQMVNDAYDKYAKWFHRKFHQDTGGFLYIGGTTKYGLSAYEIAVNHGFEGTEEEWLEAIRGKEGPTGPAGAGLNIVGQVYTEAELPYGDELEQGVGYLVGEGSEALLYVWNGSEWFYKQKLSGKGEPGPAGDPGVYVSETEPTDPEALIWINPSGKPTPGGGTVDLTGYATEEWVEERIAEAELGGGGGGGTGEDIDLSDYAKKSELPTKVSQLTNDAGYLTQHQSLAGYAKTTDIPTKLSELTGDSTHRTVTDAEKTAWNNKSDFSGAYSALTGKPTIPSKTSQLTNDSGFLTAVPSGYATEDYVKGKIAEAELGGDSGEIDLSGYALKSELPTKTSQLTNDSGYLTAVPDGYAKTEDIPAKLSDLTADSTHRTVTDSEKAAWSAKSDFSGAYADLTGKPTIPTTLAELSGDASHRTVTDTEKSTWNAKSNFSGNYNDLTNKPTIPSAYTHPSSHPASMITGLATVATSGSYNDLTNKPTIPSAYSHPESHPASMITGLATVATSGSYNDLSNKPTIPSAYSHPSTHAASMISAGTFAGQVVANSSGQAPGTSLLRNSKIVSAEATPTVNGEIFWTYG